MTHPTGRAHPNSAHSFATRIVTILAAAALVLACGPSARGATKKKGKAKAAASPSAPASQASSKSVAIPTGGIAVSKIGELLGGAATIFPLEKLQPEGYVYDPATCGFASLLNFGSCNGNLVRSEGTFVWRIFVLGASEYGLRSEKIEMPTPIGTKSWTSSGVHKDAAVLWLAPPGRTTRGYSQTITNYSVVLSTPTFTGNTEVFLPGLTALARLVEDTIAAQR